MDTPTNIPTFQELVESGLKKFDIVVPAIEELKKTYLPLKIKSIDDKEGYEKVSKALRFMISKRNEVEEKRKELKADSLSYGKAVDNRAKEITFLLTPIEEYLRSEKDRIDDEIEAIKEQKIREEQERLNIRNRRLLQAGMKLVGNEYFWQNPNDLAQVEILPSVNLETLDDLSFDEYIEKINVMAKEQQAIFDSEQKRLSQEREKLEQEQKKFREEMEMMKAQRTKMRLESLYQIGLVSITNLNSVCYKFGDEYVSVISYPEVETSDNWEETLKSVVLTIESIKQQAAENQKAEQERIAEAQKRAEEIAIQKLKDEKELAEKMEAERIAQLSDKDKFAEWVQKMLDIPPPAVKTKKWKIEVTGLRGLIANYE
jgi:hypothetical protein